MVFLITKEEDPIAYSKMMEVINHLKINGDKIKPWLIKDNLIGEKIVEPEKITQHNNKIDFSYSKQIKKKLLESLRDQMSLKFKRSVNSILPNQLINEIICKSKITDQESPRGLS